MIVVHINPSGVEEVYLQSTSDLAEDLCLAAWPVIRQELGKLDKKLKRATDLTLKKAEREGL